MPTDPKSRWITSLMIQSAAPGAPLPWSRAAKHARRMAHLNSAIPFAARIGRASHGSTRGLAHS